MFYTQGVRCVCVGGGRGGGNGPTPCETVEMTRDCCEKGPLKCRFPFRCSDKNHRGHRWGGWVRQRCRVSCVTGASNWYWLTDGQGLLSLQQVTVEGGLFLFLCFFTVIHFHFSPVPSLSSPLLSLLSLFSLSLRDDTKWHTKVGVSLNPQSVKIGITENACVQLLIRLSILYLSVHNDGSTVVHQMYIFWAYSRIYIIITDLIVKKTNRFDRAIFCENLVFFTLPPILDTRTRESEGCHRKIKNGIAKYSDEVGSSRAVLYGASLFAYVTVWYTKLKEWNGVINICNYTG